VPQTIRRLPGVRFERQAPPLLEALPRMDIAAFVGFAASGPLDVPVPVEDAAQFARIFGADAPIAWDRRRGESAPGLLGPAVRAFFRNGGRRCWVVRVADRADAKADMFALPGVAAVVEPRGTIAPAVLRARCEGSWADQLSVSVSIEPTPVRFQARSFADLTFDATLASPNDLVAGDLVRVTFPRSPWALYVGVASLARGGGSPPDLQHPIVHGGPAWWVRVTAIDAGRTGYLHYLGAHGLMRAASATVVDRDVVDAEGLVRIALHPDAGSPPEPTTPPAPGSLVRGVFGTRSIWLDVVDVDVAPDGTRAIVATPFQVTRSTPRARLEQAPDSLAERLTLRLKALDDAGGSVVLSGLGFLPAHPRFVGALPTDVSLYEDPALAVLYKRNPSALAARDEDPPAPPLPGTLAADAAQPRFPLAGPHVKPLLYLPFGSTILEGPALPAMRPPGLARLRDGLQQLEARVFLDPALTPVGAERLLEEALWIAYRQPNPRRLRGIHALLRVEEATIVAVPDAVQREWYLAPGAPIPEAGAPELAPPIDWSRFLDCATDVPLARVLELEGDEEAGAFTLSWGNPPDDTVDAAYELQESVGTPDAAAAVTLYRGPALEFSVYGRPRGSTLYYRVRAIAGGLASDWSNWVTVRTTQTSTWLLEDASRYDASATLLPVQLAVLRLCAARGDLFAALALPEHYREREAIGHVHKLKSSTGRPPGSEPDPIFSNGALYHPWLFASDPGNPSVIRRFPPDGAAAGVIAARAARRGAWVSPANEPLHDVVQLDPPLGADWLQALQDAQVNVVRHEPGGFLWLAADTLSADAELRPIGVRRLLHVLGRVAVRHGAIYAFEPNTDAFRRTVQRGFERLLARMFELGAFSGASASDAYRVNTGSPPNTLASIEAGCLIVELKVAPSRPLEFLTVRLVRTGEGLLQVEAR
jgi:hypothetical protein